MTKQVSRSEADRLGKRGSYRLGGFGPAGPVGPTPPRPYLPSFTGPQHRGTVSGWIFAAIAGALVIAGAALAGLWFMPFVIGLATGIVVRWGGWRVPVAAPAVVTMAAAGWGLALCFTALRGLPVGATARTIAIVGGLPPVPILAVAITLGVSAVLALAGLWLGRAIAPRPTQE